MRPHKLLLKAFGPFAKETIVDFDAMGNNIYLISGDTGAGKTTIFDGIIYALYGKASGDARTKNLTTDEFHSDYAKDGSRREEMRVEFTFSNAGRTFTVSRRMFWGKKGDSKTASKQSTLSENGNTIVHSKGSEVKDDVTKKVTEILGLDADEFRRIIMLAQGEFQKFLTSPSDKRGEILGKLYDNRMHQDFQMRLKAAAALLKEQENSCIVDARAQIRLFVVPEEIGQDDRAAIAVDHPLLLSTVERINKQMDSDLETVKGRLLDQEKKKTDLASEKVLGEKNNGLLDELNSKREQLEKLIGKKEQIDDLRKLVRLAEPAARVIPYEEALLQAKRDWENILERIKTLEEEQRRLAEQEEKLKAEKERLEQTRAPEIEKLKAGQEAINTILHFYDDLAASVAHHKEMTGILKTAESHLNTAEETLSGKKSKQKSLEKELQRLESAGENAVSNALRAFKDLQKRKEDLGKISSSIKNVNQLMEDEKNLKNALTEAGIAELEAGRKHQELNTAFINGQAGILAQDLREKLQKEPEVVCPVCGAVHTAADLHLFAEWHKDIPTRDDVDAAYASLEEAHRAVQNAERKHSAKETELKEQQADLLRRSGELISVHEWDLLINGTVLSESIDECESDLTSAKAHYDQAVSDKEAKENALRQKMQNDKELREAEEAREEANQKKSEAEKKAAEAETSVKNWKMQLRGYPESKASAVEQRDSLGIKAAGLQKQIDDAKTNHSECIKKQEANKGNLAGANFEKETRKKAVEKAEKAFSTQLKMYSFVDETAYRKALSPEGETLDQEKIVSWIEGRKREIDAYDREQQDLAAVIKQLEDSTKDIKRVDLSAIEEDIKRISQQVADIKNAERSLAANLQTNQSVLDELKKIQDMREKYRKAAELLKPLADTANGKFSFSRYVLLDFFQRIVEQANIHLDTMTDGEYCLVPCESEGDGRSAKGLGLMILNTITNLERKTATLSGGQLFEASLSLALGLSDVVQMESSGSIQVDSMFIDEGFGSLDGGRLDKSIEVLEHLSGGRRQIGIISHVSRLEECIPKKIHVIAGERGSTVRIETDA